MYICAYICSIISILKDSELESKNPLSEFKKLKSLNIDKFFIIDIIM